MSLDTTLDQDTDLTPEDMANIAGGFSVSEKLEMPDSQTDSLSEEEKSLIENSFIVDAEVEELDTGSEMVEEPLPVSRVSRDLPPQAIAPKQRSLMSGLIDVEKEPEIEKIPLQAYADSPEFIAKVNTFMSSAFGENGQQKENESNRDYLERWLTEKRKFESNSLYMVPQLDWLRTASQEERNNFADIWTETTVNMADFTEEGGGNTASAIFDYLWYNISDPLILLSPIVSKLAVRGSMEVLKQTLKVSGRKAALEQAKQLAKKSATKEGVATGLLVGTELGAKDLGTQRIAQAEKTEDEVDFDFKRAAQMAALGFGLGAPLGAASGYFGSKAISKTVIGVDDMAKKAAAERLKKAQESLVKKESQEGIPEDAPTFDPVEGEHLINELAKVKHPDLLKGSLKTDLHKRMNAIAFEIVEQQQLLGKPLDIELGKKASEVVRNILLTTRIGRDTFGRQTGQVMIDSDVLERAVANAGLTEQQFMNIAGKSLSDSGADLAAYSQFGKWLIKNRKVDPELDARLKALNSTKNKKTIGYLGKVYDVFRRADRERRAAGVVAPSTTWGNITTALLTAPIRAATNTVESALYHGGRGLYNAHKGEFDAGVGATGWKEFTRDSLGLLYRLARPIESAEISQRVLSMNKSLLYQIERAIADASGDQAETLSAGVRYLNSLNMIQDVYVRRAVFSYSLDKQLRRQGINLDDVLVGNKGVPVAILKNAVDDSMKATFSYMPKFGESQSLAGIGNSAGYAVIKIAEAVGPLVPVIGTADNAYPRFFINALAFNLAHSPISIVDGATNLYRGIAKKYSADIIKAQKKLDDLTASKKGKTPDGKQEEIEATLLLNDARDKLSKFAVGSSLLLASYKYRLENQDIPPHMIRNSSGRLSDLRKFVPIVPYAAMGDVLAKIQLGTTDKINIRDFITDFAGTRLRSPISFAAFDDLLEVIQADGSEGKTLTGERVGEMVGEWAVRVFNLPLAPARFLSDMWAQIDQDEALARNRKELEGVGGLERFGETVQQGIMYTLPLFKQLLPEAEDPTREATRIKQAPLYRALFGISRQERTSALEKELLRLGIKSYELVPRMKDERAKSLVKLHMGVFMEGEFTNHIETDYYKSLSDDLKEVSFNNKLLSMRKIAREFAELQGSLITELPNRKPDPFNRERYVNLPKKIRMAIDLLFSKRYDGKTVLDVQAENRNKDIFAEALEFEKVISELYKSL